MKASSRRRLAVPLVLLVIAVLVALFTLRRKEFFYAGTIEATQVDVPSRLASVVGHFAIKEGEKVTAGQTLVRLSGEEFKIAADAAAADYQRASRLFRSGSIPQENFEHLKTRRDEAALKWSWCTITSPIAGTVLNTYRETGEWVSPGTKLLTLADLSEVWAMIYVEQPVLSRISLGMELSSLVAEAPERPFKGKIVRIADEAEFTPKNVQTRQERARLVFGVKVAFANPDGFLKPGMSVEVRLPK